MLRRQNKRLYETESFRSQRFVIFFHHLVAYYGSICNYLNKYIYPINNSYRLCYKQQPIYSLIS